MSDETSKLDQLKLIPQVFFDLIGRVVPGAIAIVAALLLSKTNLESWLRDTLGAGTIDSPLVVLTIFLATAYVVGQMLSPLAKGVQRVGELEWLKLGQGPDGSHTKEPDGSANNGEGMIAKSIRRIFGSIRKWKSLPKAEGYDWLRLHYPAAGDQCAKIRAEFTMHNGIAVVFLVSTIVYPLHDSSWQWPVLLALGVSSVLAGIRGRTTRDTFHKTVKKFTDAAERPKRSP